MLKKNNFRNLCLLKTSTSGIPEALTSRENAVSGFGLLNCRRSIPGKQQITIKMLILKCIDFLMLGMHSFLQPATLALTRIWTFWEMNSVWLTLKDTEHVSRFAQTASAANFLPTFPSKIHATRRGEVYFLNNHSTGLAEG